MRTLRKFVIEFSDGSIERLYLEDVEKREDGLYATIEKDGQRFTVKRVVDPTKEPEATGTRWKVYGPAPVPDMIERKADVILSLDEMADLPKPGTLTRTYTPPANKDE